VTKQVKLLGERQDISDWLDVDIFVFLRIRRNAISRYGGNGKGIASNYSAAVSQKNWVIRVPLTDPKALVHSHRVSNNN